MIGDPVRHSLSPAIHNAGFRAAGLDWVFVALPVAAGDAVEAVHGARVLGIEGLSVTMPHKEAVAPALDGLSEVATELGAVNCIHRDPEDSTRLLGDNTDGEGFLAGLAADMGMEVESLRCVVVGAGGAARAVTRAMAGAGAAEVSILSRNPERAGRAAALAGGAGRVVSAEEEPTALRDADLVVNATPLGMSASHELPTDPGLFRVDQAVVDLIYHPAETAWLRAARSCGARTANGLSMLVHQAAAAFERWTGVAAPVEAMRAAARGAASRSG